MAGYYISLRPTGLEHVKDDLHITIAYLGKLDHVDVRWIKAALGNFAEDWPGLKTHIFGLAVWIAGPSYFTVGLLDGWEIRELHDQVVDVLEGQGISYSDRYPFLPHVTLAESSTPLGVPLITGPIPIAAHTLYLSKDDVHIPLNSEAAPNQSQQGTFNGGTFINNNYKEN